jgi:hypothetical protein
MSKETGQKVDSNEYPLTNDYLKMIGQVKNWNYRKVCEERPDLVEEAEGFFRDIENGKVKKDSPNLDNNIG